MKKPMKIILKYAIIFICLIILFALLLTLTSMIPRKNIEENAKESAEILVKQTDKLYIPVREWLMYFDNFTDALMVNTAYSIDENTPFYSALVARRNYIPGVTKNIYEDRKGELGSFDIYDENELKQTEELYKTVNGDIENSFEYARPFNGHFLNGSLYSLLSFSLKEFLIFFSDELIIGFVYISTKFIKNSLLDNYKYASVCLYKH